MLLHTHGFWASLFAPRGRGGRGGGAGSAAGAELRRRAGRVGGGGGAANAPLLWLGGALGIRLTAARLVAQALRRGVARWRAARRRARAHKLG
jgi:hypothetical protein